ncbi:SDR family oxidoreductase [Treponema sp. C6A8]|uniref:SDR family NAD(P)-dependent oxidoreductase n=1 Tax=Treponema sp. C6A8 TaxID=1410609 RepID=UPI00056DF519|nr:SDR family NAD(P)-dependent oxidoreductase [Treponema sp. C6A8]
MKKIGIITGASSGMGAEFARQLAQKNLCDELWIVARRSDRLEELKAEIENDNKISIIPVALDLTGSQGAQAFSTYLKENFPSDAELKILVNNAGFGTYGPFEETPVEREMQMIDLNCTSLTGICGYALPYMKKEGLIINTASLAAFMPLGNFAVYAATKAYVLNFSLALAAELKPRGISVTALCPGSVSTEFANVASNGVRKEVKGGRSCEKTVAHCIKRALARRHTALAFAKWRITAFLSRFVGRYLVAELTFKYNKRPH